ncbi:MULTISPECIES: hypothetical protein [Paracoccus]|uniref:hypothetical protein n=1 Tax=Paracoccus TaxID=265 RepID=UPI001F0A5F63|nr:MULTISPECIES: hypothetical protein [Paracoccus]
MLIAGLTEPDRESEVREAIRGLIEKIVATPVPTAGKRNRLELTLHGDLAGDSFAEPECGPVGRTAKNLL